MELKEEQKENFTLTSDYLDYDSRVFHDAENLKKRKKKKYDMTKLDDSSVKKIKKLFEN